MPDPRLRDARRAERRAARHLARKGYLILERNVRVGHGEIDLVCCHEDMIVFVEVRFRSAGLGEARESIEGVKERHLISAARRYLRKEGLRETPWRIDLVSVSRDASGKPVLHHEVGAVS